METTSGLKHRRKKLISYVSYKPSRYSTETSIFQNVRMSECQNTPLIYAWDVKVDAIRNYILIANGKVTTGPSELDIWSGVVNIESVQIALFLAKLNGLKIIVADISLAY